MPLAEAIKDAETALADAKVRAGQVAVFSGRFSEAEAEIAELKTAPDQADTVDRAYALERSLKAVPRQQFPAWVIASGAGAGACFVVGKVGGVDFKKVGLVALLATAAVYGGQQMLAKKPSSKDRLKLDEGASRLKAEEDARRSREEADRKDTEKLEDDARRDQQARDKKRAVDAGVLNVAKQPEFSPKPSGESGFRFGYWADGKHVDVPLNAPITFQGKLGTWKNTGTAEKPVATFVPDEKSG